VNGREFDEAVAAANAIFKQEVEELLVPIRERMAELNYSLAVARDSMLTEDELLAKLDVDIAEGR
jgi:hypothetical protein